MSMTKPWKTICITGLFGLVIGGGVFALWCVYCIFWPSSLFGTFDGWREIVTAVFFHCSIYWRTGRLYISHRPFILY